MIATWNRSNVLRYALRSVRAQTFRDFEVLVVGDGCSDDTAAVVASFDDPRIRFENLPTNSGHQSAPNNHALAHARGEWIAYLGHDDLWHPRHLEDLDQAARVSGADVVFSLCILIEPDGRRAVTGLFHDGRIRLQMPPSSVMHRRALVDRVGGWKDYRTIALPPDVELLARMQDAGARFHAVERPTTFKFSSSTRKDCYLERPCHEQAAFWARLEGEPEVCERELVEALRTMVERTGGAPDGRDVALNAPPGLKVQQLRWMRGLAPELAPMAALPATVTPADLPLEVGPVPATLAAGARIELPVRVENRSTHALCSMLPHPVHLSYRWFAADGRVLVADGLRTLLEPALAPGAARTYPLTVEAPAAPGTHLLRVSLVQELVRWLDADVPGMARDFHVRVEAPPVIA